MENPEWIRELSKIFKEHWTERYDAEMERRSKVLQDIKAKKQEKSKLDANTEDKLSLEERVAQVGQEYKKNVRIIWKRKKLCIQQTGGIDLSSNL